MDRINVYLEDGATPPTRKFPTDAGLDFYSNYYYDIKPGSIRKIKTGVSIELDPGYALFLWPKSRSNYDILGGVIDSDYRGEIVIKIHNPLPDSIVFHKGDAIAQGVIQKIATPAVVINYTGKPSKTERGKTGGIIDNDGEI